MANYDSTGLMYDSGVLYDGIVLPQPFKRMSKFKVKLSLNSKPDADLLGFAQAHVTAVTGNTNFTTLLPSAADFTAALTPYQEAFADFNTAQAAAKLATTRKDTARVGLESVLSQRGNYVELIAASASDPQSVIASAGFSVRSGKTPPGIPDPVGNLSITAGDNAGELDLQWDFVAGAYHYNVETSPEPMTDTSWMRQKDVTKSQAVVLGLTSGAKMWARVRAIGPGGTGAWSDPATKIVP
jgi:hypothetical protein